MKQTRFRNDGVGVAVGRLSSPTTLKYEKDGHIGTFELTGNVLETEYNDVFVLGHCISETEMRVEKMESIPLCNDKYLGFKCDSEQGEVLCIAIPKNMVKAVEEKFSPNETKYYSLTIELEKNDHMYLSVFGAFEQNIRTGSYIFILRNNPQVSVNEYGSGYAIKKVTTRMAAGWQIVS